MSEQVHVVTDLPKPSKALWKTGLKTIVATTVVAIVGSAVYHTLKKDNEDETSNPAA